MLFAFKLYTIKQEDELSHVHKAQILSPKSRYNDFYRYDVYRLLVHFFVIYITVTIDLVYYYFVGFFFSYFFQFYLNGIM